jgi:GGDEF domain-containing protein
MHPPIVTNAALVPQLHTALQDYAQWFRALISGLGRDNARIGDVTLTTPDSWVALEPYLGDIYPDLITAQRAVLAELAALTPALMTGTGVARRDMAGLTTAYMAFQQVLMGHVNDILFSLSDIDFVTFLRHPQWLEREWGREMERLTRDGKSFCVCLARLKILPPNLPVSTTMPEGDLAHLRQAAAVMARCVRSFDDVFCLEDGVFVILLRQTNHAGGVRFIRRLQDVMVETGQKRPVPVDLGFISCIAEPVIGESLPNLLTQMRQDMVSQAEGGQAIATRREISPLARYVATLSKPAGT